MADHLLHFQGMPPEDDEVDRAAAAWLIEKDNGMTPARLRELEQWLEADPRHRQIFAELAADWRRLDSLRAPVGAQEHQAVRRPRAYWGPLAAAAGLALAALVLWRSGTHSQAARLEIYSAGERPQTATLADGSKLELQPHTRLEVRFSAQERDVRLLDGTADFAVAKNAARPFIVAAGPIAVRAVGTEFTIELQRDALEVSVSEGRVQVDDVRRNTSALWPAIPSTSPLLVAGQRAKIGFHTPDLAVTVVSQAGPPRAPTVHQLDFAGVPLSDMVAEFNRYNAKKLIIADPQLGNLRFGGTFTAEDNDTLVRMLEANFSVLAERRADGIVLRLGR